MSISITNTDLKISESNKTRNMYDNYDNLVSVIKYDDNNKVDYIIKSKNNASGKSAENIVLQQVQVDITSDRPATDVTESSARLRARVYKNSNSVVYETGFIYWIGNSNEDVTNKQSSANQFSIPSVFKGNFSRTITDLKDNATYNYRAFVKHEYGTNYSDVKQFTTVDKSTIFAIDGDRFSGPSPLTVNLTAINAGFGNFTYAWNMTGGPIGFNYPLNSITVSFSGEGYTPLATNYTLSSIFVSVTGNGYDNLATINVLVNDEYVSVLTADLGLNQETSTYGITSVTVPVEVLSGYKTSTFNITFSSSNDSTITEIASGTGSGSTYLVTRENIVLVDGTYQPSLSVITYLNPENGLYAVSAIEFLSGPIVYSDPAARVLTLSSNGPVDLPAILAPSSSINITNADYISRTITHSYSGGGNYTPKVYAIQGNQIIKEAIKIIRVTGSSNFAPEWQPVLTSPFANNITAAYDLRNFSCSPSINELAYTTYNFAPENTIGGYFQSLPSFKSPLIGVNLGGDGIGGYPPLFYFAGYAPIAVGGYPIAGYDFNRMFGPGLSDETSRSTRFEYTESIHPIGGYLQRNGFVYRAYVGNFLFSNDNPFSISLWVMPQEFNEPGTRLLSFTTVSFQNEFSITQSTSALTFFRNLYLSEVVGGYLTNEPIAGYFTGYPMLCTIDPSKMLTPGQWNYLTVTRDRNKTYKYYKNGTLMLSSTDTGWGVGGYDNFGGDFGFGGRLLRSGGVGGYVSSIGIGNSLNINSTVAPLSGLVNSMSIWRKELSQDEITELYNGGLGGEKIGYYNPIVGPKLWIGGTGRYFGVVDTNVETSGDSYLNNVSLLLDFDGPDNSYDFLDLSSNNVTVSSTGATVTTATKLFGTGSGKFNTVGGYLMTLSGEDYGAFGVDDFTIEWWEYIAGYGVNNLNPVMFYGNPGISRYNSGADQMLPQWGIVRGPGGYGPGTELRFYMGNLTTFAQNYRWTKYLRFNDNINTAGGGFQLSGWSHNVIQRKRIGGYVTNSNADYYFYKNGALAGYLGGYQCVDIGSTPVYYFNGIAGYNGIVGFGPGTGTIGGGIVGGYTDPVPGAWQTLDGYIDGLRITKGVARYNSNFTIPQSAFPTEVGEYVGTRFNPSQYREGSYAVAQETIPATYPYTLAFIGKADITKTNRTVFQNLQSTYSYGAGINLNLGPTDRAIYSNADIFNGLYPSNPSGFIGIGTQGVGGYTIVNRYFPTGSEWFYISYSFLGPENNNFIRYYLQTPTVSSEGVVAGYGAISFNGIPGFGIGGYALGPSWATSSDSVQNPINTINGVGRLGLYINQAFPNHSDMVNLFQAITAGPANNIKLQ